MSEEDTYLRAKLTEINSSINGLTEMLNRMIDVMSKIQKLRVNIKEWGRELAKLR